jgi:hypothetical protein
MRTYFNKNLNSTLRQVITKYSIWQNCSFHIMITLLPSKQKITRQIFRFSNIKFYLGT